METPKTRQAVSKTVGYSLKTDSGTPFLKTIHIINHWIVKVVPEVSFHACILRSLVCEGTLEAIRKEM